MNRFVLVFLVALLVPLGAVRQRRSEATTASWTPATRTTGPP